MKTRIDKPTNSETWKSKAVDLAERFDKAQAHIADLRRMLYASHNGGAKFLCRTDGKYTGDLGSWWYRVPDGMILAVDHEDRSIATYKTLAEALALYSTLQAAHNVAAYQKLAALELPEVAA